MQPLSRLGVIGFGDFGRQICGWLAESGDQVADVVAFDDTISEAAGVTVAPFADALADRWGDLRFAVGLGYLHLGMRGQLIADLLDAGRAVASVVHPSAWVSPSATLGAGCGRRAEGVRRPECGHRKWKRSFTPERWFATMRWLGARLTSGRARCCAASCASGLARSSAWRAGGG